MPAPEDVSGPLKDALTRAFGKLVASDTVDIVTLESGDELEVQGDAWTLYVRGWPLAEAWVALDEEGASVAEQREDLTNAFGTLGLTALRVLDAELSGALTERLLASADPLSATLAGMLA